MLGLRKSRFLLGSFAIGYNLAMWARGGSVTIAVILLAMELIGISE